MTESMPFFLVHIAVAVETLDKATSVYAALGFELGEPEIIERENVRLQKVTKDGVCLELIEPYPADTGSVARYLAKRGPGLHHVAFKSDDIQGDLMKLQNRGINVLHGYPAKGSEGTLVAFLNPQTTGGVLIELVEKKQTKVV